MSASQVVPYDDRYDDPYGGRYDDDNHSRRSHHQSRRNDELYYPQQSSQRLARRPRSDRYDDNSSLPSAYYRDPARESPRHRQRSLTPPTPRRTHTRKGDIISAVAGAAAVTAADKFFVEPRMNKRSGGRGRSKSQHEALRRAADIGAGGIAGTAIYRAVSRSRANKKARSESRGRGHSSDSRDSRDSRGGSPDKKHSRSQSIPWKSLVTTAGGALAGLVAERAHSSKSQDRNNDSRSRNRRDSYDDYDSDDSGRSRKSRRSKSTRDDRSSRRDDRSDGGDRDDDDDRRERRRRRNRDRDRDGDRRGGDQREQNPHHTRDLVQEAIGLLGVAQGLRGKDKGKAAVETAIGAYGLAQNYYSQHQGNKPRPRN